MEDKCKNCEIIENGSIIRTTKESKCVSCGRQVGGDTIQHNLDITKHKQIEEILEEFDKKFIYLQTDLEPNGLVPEAPTFVNIKSFLKEALLKAHKAGENNADWMGEKLLDAHEKGKQQGIDEAVEKTKQNFFQHEAGEDNSWRVNHNWEFLARNIFK